MQFVGSHGPAKEALVRKALHRERKLYRERERERENFTDR